MLNFALQQSGWEGPQLSEFNWKSILSDFLSTADFDSIRKDVAPFLIRSADQDLLNLKTIQGLL